MVADHIPSSWSLRSLGESDRGRVLSFLDQEPLLNAYLISRILDEGLTGTVPFVEVSCEGEPIVVAMLASNVVGAVATDASPDDVAVATGLVAQRICDRAVAVRAIISDERFVEPLWDVLRAQLSSPTVVRWQQPVYHLPAARANALPSELVEVRYAQPSDLPELVDACAAMHREEVGIDPLVRDPVGYRQRVLELVRGRRSLVRMDGRTIAFKCEYSAVTWKCIQLMGVWTDPAYRRQGIARSAMIEICGHIAADGRDVTLFVNDFNTAAIALYEDLGFERIGTNRALIW